MSAARQTVKHPSTQCADRNYFRMFYFAIPYNRKLQRPECAALDAFHTNENFVIDFPFHSSTRRALAVFVSRKSPDWSGMPSGSRRPTARAEAAQRNSDATINANKMCFRISLIRFTCEFIARRYGPARSRPTCMPTSIHFSFVRRLFTPIFAFSDRFDDYSIAVAAFGWLIHTRLAAG